ncbi:MAG: ATP-binding protein [Burkholderiaceae bacterium]
MRSRLTRIWNQLSQFRQLVVVASAVVGSVGVIGAIVLVMAVGGEYRRKGETTLLRSAEATVSTLALRARDADPVEVRRVLAQYQIVPGLARIWLINGRDETVAVFDRDGGPEPDELPAPPVRRQPTLGEVGNGWLSMGGSMQRLWFPAAWQGFSGWLVIDQRLDHLNAMRAWTIGPALLLLAAFYGSLLAALWWLASGQKRALHALEQYIKRGGATAYPSTDDLRAPRELWAMADGLRDAWKHLKHNQREIEITGRRNRELFDATHDAAFIIDEHGQILTANRAANALFGFSAAEFEGMHADQLVADESMNDYREWWKEYWRTGAAPRQDRPLRIRALRRNRKSFEAELLLVQIRGGDACEFAVTYRDISETLVNESRLGTALRTAEEAARARNALVSSVSHELRTPMNAIIGMAELALASAPSGVVQGHLTTIRACGRQMAAIVDDVLDTSRMDSGRLEIDMRPFDFGELLDELRAVYEPVARHKGLRFSVERRDAMPPALIGDAVRIRQVLDNLLVNAFKFTETGSVKVVCQAGPGRSGHGDGEPGARRHVDVAIAVIDTGMGIPVSRQEAIFEPFAQGDAATARRYGGVGLGLSLSRRLAQLMGGMLWVESDEGGGSTFSLKIPCLPASPEEVVNMQRVLADGNPNDSDTARLLADRVGAMRVIVAEEDDDNRRLLHDTLTREGLRVTVCSDGREALEAWRAHAPELVIVGLSIARLDGFALAREIRRAEAGNRNLRRVRIVGLSAAPLAEIGDRCREAGFDDCLTKPIAPAQVLHKVADLLAAQALDGKTGEPAERRLTPAPVSHMTTGHGGWGLSSSGDPRLMQRILSLAIKELPDRILRLREAADKGDTLWIQRHAHSLVNTLVALSQTDAADLARTVEAGASQDRMTLEAMIVPLVRSIEAMLPGLRHQLAELESGQFAVH